MKKDESHRATDTGHIERTESWQENGGHLPEA